MQIRGKFDNRAFISYSIAQYTIYYEPINDIRGISAPPSIILSGTIIYFVTLRYIVNYKKMITTNIFLPCTCIVPEKKANIYSPYFMVPRNFTFSISCWNFIKSLILNTPKI